MKRSMTVIVVAIAVLAGGGAWYVQSKLPTRQGQVALATLQPTSCFAACGSVSGPPAT